MPKPLASSHICGAWQPLSGDEQRDCRRRRETELVSPV
jgi:hypothetical protein